MTTTLTTMDAEQLRLYLGHYVHNSGAASELKARLKTVLMSRLMSQQDISRGASVSLLGKALNVFVASHLQRIGFECSHNVFMAEVGTGTTMSEDEARVVLRVKDEPRTLEEVIEGLHRAARLGLRTEDAHVQATPDVAGMSLEERLSLHDRELEIRMASVRPDAHWEARLRHRAEEIEVMVRGEAKAEGEGWRRRELDAMRAEEGRKYRALLEGRGREYAELEQQLRHQLSMERFEVQQRKRELEAQAAETESERTRLSTDCVTRERSASVMHRELLDTRDRNRAMVTQVTLLTEQVRDLQLALEVATRRVAEGDAAAARWADEKTAAEFRHTMAMEGAQRVLQTGREEVTQRALDVEHRLQGEQMRLQKDAAQMRDHYEREEGRLATQGATMAKREEVLRKAVADAQRAIAAQHAMSAMGSPLPSQLSVPRAHMAQEPFLPQPRFVDPVEAVLKAQPVPVVRTPTVAAVPVVPIAPPAAPLPSVPSADDRDAHETARAARLTAEAAQVAALTALEGPARAAVTAEESSVWAGHTVGVACLGVEAMEADHRTYVADEGAAKVKDIMTAREDTKPAPPPPVTAAVEPQNDFLAELLKIQREAKLAQTKTMEAPPPAMVSRPVVVPVVVAAAPYYEQETFYRDSSDDDVRITKKRSTDSDGF